MKVDLLDSEGLWRDEAFLARMTACAQLARGWTDVPFALTDGRTFPVAPSFVPEFGGCYVIPGRGGDDPLAWVLCRADAIADAWPTAAEASGVLLLPLAVDAVADFLVERGLVSARPESSRIDVEALDEGQSWVALDYLARAGRLTPAAAADPRRAMRGERDVHADYLELEDVRLRATAVSGPVELGSFSPVTRLRVMPPVTQDAATAAFVRHLQAFLDPAWLPRTVREAPDLLLARLPHASPELAGALASFLDGKVGGVA
jgi:hypothetical protein